MLSIEPKARKCVKGYGFLSFTRNLSNKYRKIMLDIGIDALKTVSIKVIYKAAEAISRFFGDKIADKIVKPKNSKHSSL